MTLQFEVHAKIAKPVAEVFRAVTDPKQLSSYFTTGGASAAPAEGATVIWKFGDYPGDIPVRVTRVVVNERIEFSWETNEGGYDTAVVMGFEAQDGGTTLVRIVGIRLARHREGAGEFLRQLFRLDADALLPEGLGRARDQPAAGILLADSIASGNFRRPVDSGASRTTRYRMNPHTWSLPYFRPSRKAVGAPSRRHRCSTCA